MYRLFKTRPFRGRIISTDFITMRSKLQLALGRAMDRWAGSVQKIPNQHLLKRIIGQIDYIPDSSPGETRLYLSRNHDRICAALGITTYRNVGEYHSDTFYSEYCMVAMSDFWQPGKGWRQLRPVQALTHQVSELTLMLPIWIRSEDPLSYAVVGIDVSTLGFMHHSWMQEQMLLPEDERGNLDEFLSLYVLPGMLESHMDIVLRNRYGIRRGMNRVSHDIPSMPFAIEVNPSQLDDGMDEIIGALNTGRRGMGAAQQRLPLLYHDDYSESIPKQLQILSTPSYWVTFVIYLDWAYEIASVVKDLDLSEGSEARTLKAARRFYKASGAQRRYGDIAEVVATKFKTLEDLL